MSQGNQSNFKTTNESVERYAVLVENYKWGYDEENDMDIKVSTGEIIMGIYKGIRDVKLSLKWIRKNNYLNVRIAKVRISIEELEEIKLGG